MIDRRTVLAPAAVAPAAVALAAIALVAAACSETGRVSGCPAGSGRDEARAARLAALLGDDAGVAARLHRVQPTLCFGSDDAVAGGVVVGAPDPTGGPSERPVVVLDASGSDPALAARLAHLVRHVEEPPFAPGTARGVVPCGRVVVRAARLEAVAARDEERVRERLGLGPGSPGSGGEDVIGGYLARCRDRR